MQKLNQNRISCSFDVWVYNFQRRINDLIFQITLMLVVDAVITFTAWLPRSIGLVYAELNNDRDINLVAGMISWLIRMLIISSSRLHHLNTSA